MQASDGTNTSTVTVALTESNLNDNNPAFGAGSYSFTYAENQTAGAVLGTVSASDADLADAVTYSITGGDPNGWFQIDSAGQISLTTAGAASLANDFEALANTRNLTVQASDGTNTSTVTVALTESNLNDNNPAFGAGSYSFTYAENQTAGAVLGTVSASDADLADAVTYSITGGDPNGWFQIDSAGQISLTTAGAASLANDFEALANTRNLTVQASDGTNTSTVTVALTESNLNDNNPAFGAGSYSFTYAENQTAGAVLGTVSASDADLADAVTYSITGGDPNGWFQIDSAGQISLTTAGAASLANDFEALANTRNLTVQASDGTNTSTVTVALTESNLNDNNPAFGAGSYSFTYAENQTAGAVLGTVSASDADLADAVTYSITGGDPNGWFQIDSAGQISLTTAGAASLANDFEALANTRNLTVQASDGTNTSTVTVALTESNLNDNNPAFGAGSYSFTYAENQTAGAVLGTVSASDADLADAVTYSITGGDPNGWFQIDSAGQISLTTAGAASLANDFEALANTRNLTVQASDGTNTSTVTVALTESNLNDNNPAFGAGSYSFTYAENQTAGAVLGTVSASDADLADAVTYSITGGDPNGWFQIDSAGQISLTTAGAASLANDFEALANTRNLTVQASDGTNTSTVTVALTESNLNEAPENILPGTQTTAEDTSKAIVGLAISDVDAGGGTMTVILAVNNGTLAVSGGTATITNSGTGTVTLTGTVAQINATLASNVTYYPTANFSGSATLTMTTSDGGNTGSGGTKTDVDAVTINVTPVADLPTLTVTNTGPILLFNTSWETAANPDNTSTAVSGTTLEGWTRVDTPQLLAGGTNAFEVWSSGDSQAPAGGGNNTVYAAPGNGRNWLELNDASSNVQTIGISRSLATQAGMVYELSFDYAGRPGFTAGYTTISIQLDGVTTYSNTSGNAALDWKNLKLSFVGDGNTHTLAILTTPTQTDPNGRGAAIDDITLAAYQGVAAGNASGGTLTQIVLANYVSAGLTDTDGSETLSLTFGGLPTGAQIVTSTNTYNVSGGSITILGSELASAKLQIASSYTGLLDVTVSATATENTGGATTTTSSQMLELHIQPASGVVTATDLTDMPGLFLPGTDGDNTGNTLRGNDGQADLIEGYAGNDVLSGRDGDDILVGGAGNDTLTGGAGADTFKWSLADRGTAGAPATDTITDGNAFNTTSGERLDLRDLLVGESHTGNLAGNLANYLLFEKSGSDTVIHISSTGQFSADAGFGAISAGNLGKEDQRITLTGVDLTSGATTDQQVIQNLLTNGKLIVD